VLHEHVVARFGCRLSTTTCAVVVEIALARFLPPLYLRHSSEIGEGPDDLLRLLDDVALDVFSNGASELRLPASQATSGQSGARLVQSVFGRTDVSYLAALREAQADGARMEYLVVTEYVASQQLLGRAPTAADIAHALAACGVTSHDVERLMFRFSNRLAAQPE